jgi:hypothetical protein
MTATEQLTTKTMNRKGSLSDDFEMQSEHNHTQILTQEVENLKEPTLSISSICKHPLLRYRVQYSIVFTAA